MSENNIPVFAYCIHCHETIPFNIIRPYCKKCFNVWKSFQNQDKSENFCHLCGKQTKEISFGFPVCTDCCWCLKQN